jgi:hypothetical protein
MLQWLWVEGGGGDGNAVMSTAEEQEHLAAWETFTLHPVGDTQMKLLSSDGAWCVVPDSNNLLHLLGWSFTHHENP